MEALYKQYKIDETNLVVYNQPIREGYFGEFSRRGKITNNVTNIDREVVWKAIRERDTDWFDKDRLRIELKNLFLLKHPNILETFGLARFPGEDELIYGLILEHFDGSSLDVVIRDYPISNYENSQVLSWALQAAKGLEFMHSLPETRMFHRDIRPSNLLLNHDRSVLKICDFGLAREVTSHAYAGCRSQAYMAPEMFKGEQYDQRCDVYSWALIFWQCFTREFPFTECTRLSALNKCKQDPEYRLADIPGVSPEVQNIITQCSTHERAARPSMRAVIDRLEVLQADQSHR